ncbi:MAG: hypothetical protein EOO07_26770 [Chitinophagaceae bacterium]|nr:MAG: hypothetical protein EOO07_26770 [Chitinophagaceae bacterium]
MGLEIEVEEVLLLETYNTGTPEQRDALRIVLPGYDFPLSIIEQVTTFEEACNKLSIDPVYIAAISLPAELKTSMIMAFIRLTIITAALNEDWVADNDLSQEKHWPIQLLGNTIINGEPFISPGAVPSSSLALAFKSRELANYAGTQFLQEYIDLSLEVF